MSVDLSYFLHYLAESKAHSEIVYGVHAVSIPSLTAVLLPGSEDRYTVEKWILCGESWTFAAVFDGHGGSEAAEFVLNELPAALKTALMSELDANRQASLNDDEIAQLLSRVLVDLDNRILEEFKSLLPDDLSQVSADDAALVFQDPSSAGSKFRIEVLRALSGTTATVALIDPFNAVHVASVGDSDAFVCAADNTPTGWDTRSLGPRHNCRSLAEVARIRAEHPGEEFCVTNCVPNGLVLAVLGRITLSRALGDMPFKLPMDYTRLLLPVRSDPALEERNLTPPYLSNIPDVQHYRFPSSIKNQYLILSSDGFADLFKLVHGVTDPVELASMCASIASLAEAEGKNMAVSLLWEAFGGNNGHNIFRESVERTHSRGKVDDITVVVIPIP